MDYINCWRALTLEHNVRSSEAFDVEMCTQGIAGDLPYVLYMSKPQTFQELATKAHDMEVTIDNVTIALYVLLIRKRTGLNSRWKLSSLQAQLRR